jgi:C-terminal processing protease CtpA/Prc
MNMLTLDLYLDVVPKVPFNFNFSGNMEGIFVTTVVGREVWTAGLRPNDLILEVNGEETVGITFGHAIAIFYEAVNCHLDVVKIKVEREHSWQEVVGQECRENSKRRAASSWSR